MPVNKKIDKNIVKLLYEEGVPPREIAASMNCSYANIAYIIRTNLGHKSFRLKEKLSDCNWTHKEFDSIMGVYAIISKVGYIYIGSSKNIYNRVMQHYRCLCKGKGITKLMQEHFEKYGQDAFESIILERCYSMEEALEKEQLYLNDSFYINRLYNRSIVRNSKSIKKSTIDRIISLIHKTNSNEDCWNFGGTINAHGYGEFRKTLAHRVSYETFIGPVGSSIVGHKCNNKKCCNPKHLYLTNYGENTKYSWYSSRGLVSPKQAD